MANPTGAPLTYYTQDDREIKLSPLTIGHMDELEQWHKGLVFREAMKLADALEDAKQRKDAQRMAMDKAAESRLFGRDGAARNLGPILVTKLFAICAQKYNDGFTEEDARKALKNVTGVERFGAMIPLLMGSDPTTASLNGNGHARLTRKERRAKEKQTRRQGRRGQS